MKFKTFLEVMAGPGTGQLNLSISQKRVLRKILDAGDSGMAANDIINSEDSRNLIAAVKTLAKVGYITTTPTDLGPHDEPNSIEVTDLGQQVADEYNVQNDPKLVTKKEREESEPTEQQPMGGEGELGGMGGGLGGMGIPGEPGGLEGELGGEGGEEKPEEFGSEKETKGELNDEEGLEGETGEEKPKKLKGKNVGLELSSFFLDVNDLAKLKE